MRGVKDGARAEEQQRFEDGVVNRMVKARNQSQRRKQRMIIVQKHQSRAQTHQYDSNIFDAVISQQTLEVMFHQRIKHAQDGRNDSYGEDRHAPPVRWGPEKVEEG